MSVAVFLKTRAVWGFISKRCGQGCHSWPTAKMAHSLVFHSQRLSGQFTRENCPELWSRVGWTNQHRALRWWTNTEAATHPAKQLSGACSRSLTLVLPPQPPQSLEQLSTSVNTIETQRHPRQPSAARPQTNAHNDYPVCLLSKHPSHTQAIDFY